MNSFAVLDSPEPEEGVRTRSKQRRKSKGKTPSEEDVRTEVQSPKSSRKRKEKKEGAVQLEADGGDRPQGAQQPPTEKLVSSPDTWTYQEPRRRRWGFIGSVLEWIDMRIFQYDVTFGLYMLDRWERWLFNICALSLIFAVGYSSYKIARPYSAALQQLVQSSITLGKPPMQGNQT